MFTHLKMVLANKRVNVFYLCKSSYVKLAYANFTYVKWCHILCVKDWWALCVVVSELSGFFGEFGGVHCYNHEVLGLSHFAYQKDKKEENNGESWIHLLYLLCVAYCPARGM